MQKRTGAETNGTADTSDFIELSTIFNTLWRGRLWIAIATVAMAVTGVLFATQIATPIYRSTTELLLETTDRNFITLETALPSLSQDSQAINTEVQILRSRRLLERVVVLEGLLEEPEFNPSLRPPSAKDRILATVFSSDAAQTKPSQERQTIAAVNALLNRMVVRNVPSTDVLQITIESESAALSSRLADGIAEEYIRYKRDVAFDETRAASSWLSERVADLKLEVETAESRMSAYGTSTQAVSIESVQAMERQLKELRERQTDARIQSEEARAEYDRLTAISNASSQERASAASDRQLSTILQTVGEGEAFEERFQDILRQSRQQSANLTRRHETLQQSVALLEEKIASQNQEVITLQQLERDAEASRALYEYFLSRLKEVSAQEGIQKSEGRIISNAVLPQTPASPNVKMLGVMMGMLGFVCGCFGVFLNEMRQHSYRQPLELENDTGISVLAQVPLFPKLSRRGMLQYLTDRPASVVAESIRNLRTAALWGSGQGQSSDVIMLSSALTGEGKSTLSFALAQSTAQTGKKVLLIEGDIRRRIFNQYLTDDYQVGLADILSEQSTLKQAVFFSSQFGIYILPSGKNERSPADALASQAFEDLIHEARQQYDIIIIDTPPVLVVPDALISARVADMVLLTVRWDSTTKLQVSEALRAFETVDIKVQGLILNQVDIATQASYGYDSGYGAYDTKYYIN